MLVRLLGPVDVIADGGPRPVHGLRRKAILATLALHDGEIVSTGRLLDIVWGKTVSAAAVNTLQSHLSYLRTALGSKTTIVARSPGYVLDLDHGDIDVQRAERLLQQGTRAADPAEAVGQLQEALALWRGRPLADVTGLVWLEEQAERLDELRLRVQQALFAARLAAGEHAQLVSGLEQMVAGHPLDEQIHAQLMVALYRASRQADALAVYHRLRHTLGEELGIDPSQPLRELETAILRQDPSLDAPGPASAAVTLAPTATLMMKPVPAPTTEPAQLPSSVPVPAQLPSAVPALAGRGAELARLDALVPRTAQAGLAEHRIPPVEASAGAPGAVVISAMSGTAGVGKTALALHWAHKVAAQFPDGQLYVNLRGFDPGETAVAPAEAVRSFLDAFGVPVARIPAGLDAQAALYRSLVAGKRVLVVLDNACDSGQVRPLLPGSPGCLAIVTSRNYLAGLVAAEGAFPLSLDLLTTADARDLLTRRLGNARAASCPEAVEEIIERCARLPLALAIVAARAAANPGFPLAVIADELRQAPSALDPLDGGDTTTNARAVFSWSYHALSPDAARLFRLLGLHPGPDIAIAAVASLAAIPPEQARTLLAKLTRAHLLSEHAPGRYAFHDLLRAYATEQTHTHDSDHARHAATHRILDHYLHTAHAAAALVKSQRDLLDLAPLQPGVTPEHLDSHDDALAWFTAEHATLLAAVHHAADAGFGTHPWQLAWAMRTFLHRLGLHTVQVTIERRALEACGDSDQLGRAYGSYGLAYGYLLSGRLNDASARFWYCVRLCTALGDPAGQADAHYGLAEVAGMQGRPADSLRHAQQALDLYRATGNQHGQAEALNAIGCNHASLGDYQQALACCERALEVLQELGDSAGQANTWDSLGYAHRGLADYQQAISCYQHAINLFQGLGYQYFEAGTRARLGDTHHAAGDHHAAHTAWHQALRIFDQIDHPDGDQLRTKLRSLDSR